VFSLLIIQTTQGFGSKASKTYQFSNILLTTLDKEQLFYVNYAQKIPAL